MDAAKLEQALLISADPDQPKATRDKAEAFVQNGLKNPQSCESLINMINANPVRKVPFESQCFGRIYFVALSRVH